MFGARILPLLLLLPAFALAGSKIEYPWLDEAGANTGFNIDISFLRGDEPLTFNRTECGEDPEAFPEGCPILRHSEDDRIVVRYSIDQPLTYLDLATADNGNAGSSSPPAEPVEMEIRRCYSKFSKTNRAWRKTKDAIRKDKQCSKALKKDIDFGNGTGEITYTIPSDWPLSTNFLRILVKCRDADGDLEWCHYSNSDTSALFAVVPDDPRTTGLKVAVGICATLGPIALFIYFLTDNMKKTE